MFFDFIKKIKKDRETKLNSAFGFLLGDKIGAPFEGKSKNDASKNYLKIIGSYTDDSLMFLSVLKAFKKKLKFEKTLIEFYSEKRGYGQRMDSMLSQGKCIATDSWGNGAAIRTAALALFDKAAVSDVIKYCKTTHTHPESIRYSEAVYFAVKSALSKSKNLKKSWDIIGGRKPINKYSMGLRVSESVPPAFIVFEQSNSFADAIKNAVILGGDTDSIGALTGGLAGAFYGIPLKFKKILNKEKKIASLFKKYLF